MIRFIAAIDSKRGIADDYGIPWNGKIPGDTAYYREKLQSGTILMGMGLYKELSKPYPGGVNCVATSDASVKLRAGFRPITDARAFLATANSANEDVWNAGGAMMYTSTIDLADELYLTLLEGDFGCTKFFPVYEDHFELISSSEPMTENGISYRFTVWKRKVK